MRCHECGDTEAVFTHREPTLEIEQATLARGAGWRTYVNPTDQGLYLFCTCECELRAINAAGQIKHKRMPEAIELPVSRYDDIVFIDDTSRGGTDQS